jgi:hypothetical protein
MQGEEPSTITFSVDETLETYCSGKLVYVEFCTPDGRVVEKGDYTVSANAFTVSLTEADLVLTHDGEIQIQMIVRDVAEPSTTSVWKSKILQTTIGKSI